MTTISEADGMTTPAAQEHHGSRGARQFIAHVVEMQVVMTVGMILGTPLGVPGVQSVELRSLLWLVVMIAPMVAWMSLRGMSWRASAEMAAAMAIPTLVLLPAYWAGVIGSGAVTCLEHSTMTPVMVALMWFRRRDYGWPG